MFSVDAITRSNIKALTPYSSARDEYKGSTGVFLDANENPYPTEYNRYPDPLQLKVKAKLAALKGVGVENIFMGNGSDEAIDLPMRAFCEPGVDNVVTIAPSYGMYEVAAGINNVALRKVLLKPDYSLDIEAIRAAVDKHTKLIILCAPNNPSGNDYATEDLLAVAQGFTGILMVDEAYIDFSSRRSLIHALADTPNLMVLQTFSKAWGIAGLRLGVAYASKEIIAVLNKIKYPYNVNVHTQKVALQLLEDIEGHQAKVTEILQQRTLLAEALANLPYVTTVYPSAANFVLAKLPGASQLYQYLVGKAVIVRNRSSVVLCEDSLRITVGTPAENTLLIQHLQAYKG